MKKRFLLWALVAVLLPLGPALAEEADPDRDADLRTALRLSDLGYLTSPVSLCPEETVERALTAFCEANGLAVTEAAPQALFSREAQPPAFPGGSIPLPDTPLHTGSAVPFDAVGKGLPAGETCAVTDCGTGVVCYLVCKSAEGHALMTPSRDWDASVLSGLLGKDAPFAKRPVVLALGGENVAACLEPVASPEGEALYGLFFAGGTQGFNGIEDADRAATLAYAAGER